MDKIVIVVGSASDGVNIFTLPIDSNTNIRPSPLGNVAMCTGSVKPERTLSSEKPVGSAALVPQNTNEKSANKSLPSDRDWANTVKEKRVTSLN